MGNSPFSLHWLRFLVEQSEGRRYPEPEHPYRSPFQRDRDRILHSRAFRRLENKTQVFAPELSDHFRNRLTHTLEVTQIARTLAGVLDLNHDLTEALALVHDIGHPPFAHAGENELNTQMQRFGEVFNHNLHSLRIVESFESSYPMFPGLNLTFEVREGMVKHSRDFERGELAGLDPYRPGEKPPLEAQLIDLADETAYNTADVDDAYSAGLFPLEEIAESVPLFADILDAVQMQYPAAEARVQFLESLRRMINLLVTGLAEGTWQACNEARITSIEDVRRHPQRLVRYTEAGQTAARQLKDLMASRVYNSPALLIERERSAQRIADLFQFFLDRPEFLPEPYATQATIRPRHQVVCEYIAGMTDGYCIRLHVDLID